MWPAYPTNPEARRRLHRVPALLAEQKNRYWLVISDRANADARMHMQLHADDGRARDPGGSPFACESGCARPRERRAVGARPLGSAKPELLVVCERLRFVRRAQFGDRR